MESVFTSATHLFVFFAGMAPHGGRAGEALPSVGWNYAAFHCSSMLDGGTLDSIGRK